MELKFAIAASAIKTLVCSNRTFMELKFAIAASAIKTLVF